MNQSCKVFGTDKMHCSWLVIFLTIYSCVIGSVKCEISSAIPELLHHCYSSNLTSYSNAPLTVPLLIELIRKIELDDKNAINIRILTTSMLHGVIFDGIRKSRTEAPGDSIPYRASGNEFYRYKLSVDYLIPGQPELFPKNSLNDAEFCFLHKMLSKTVEPWHRGDEEVTCQQHKLLPYEWDYSEKYSPCPQSFGNINSRWGTIRAGNLVTSLASQLHDTSPTFQRIMNDITVEKNSKSTTVTPNQALENMTKPVNPKPVTTNNKIKTLWATGLAGSLAEVILSQASVNLEFGTEGTWNDTKLPKEYYLNGINWDMTEADILGLIDATNLGYHIKNLTATENIRLSQVLDMYYSNRGIVNSVAFNAANRFEYFSSILNEVDLQDQINGAAALLQEIGAQYEVTLSSSEISQLTSVGIEKFKKTADALAEKFKDVSVSLNNSMRAALEIIVILDGSHDPYTAEQILYNLAETTQVSYYGSKLGVINGQTGKWISNVAGEIFQLFADLDQVKNDWPSTLSLHASLETVTSYYQNKTKYQCSANFVKPLGQAILVFSKSGRLTDNDLTGSLNSIKTIKGTHPETVIMYFTPNEQNIFHELLLPSYDQDIVIKPQSEVFSLIKQISEILGRIPGSIVKFYCKSGQVRFQDYITPYREMLYEIHKEYIRRGDITIKFNNDNYGDLTICGTTSKSSPRNRQCEKVTVNGDISFNSQQFCSPGSPCDVQFVVFTNNTVTKCLERACRFPDQVRLDIRYTTSSSSSIFSKIILIVCSYLIFVR